MVGRWDEPAINERSSNNNMDEMRGSNNNMAEMRGSNNNMDEMRERGESDCPPNLAAVKQKRARPVSQVSPTVPKSSLEQPSWKKRFAESIQLPPTNARELVAMNGHGRRELPHHS